MTPATEIASLKEELKLVNHALEMAVDDLNRYSDRLEMRDQRITDLEETVKKITHELGAQQALVVAKNEMILDMMKTFNKIMDMSSFVYEPTKNRLYDIYRTAHSGISGIED